MWVSRSLRRLAVHLAVLLALPALRLAAAPIAPAAQQQTSPNPFPQNPSSGPHKVKVWTNEDLVATRTPADIYIFEKEAQAAAMEQAAFANLASCFAFDQAEGNAEETQKDINNTLQTIRDSEDAIAQSRRALRTSSENLRVRNEMELAQRTSELNRDRERLWKLQQRLQDLQKSTGQSTQPTP
jgi:hypothetical protein